MDNASTETAGQAPLLQQHFLALRKPIALDLHFSRSMQKSATLSIPMRILCLPGIQQRCSDQSPFCASLAASSRHEPQWKQTWRQTLSCMSQRQQRCDKYKPFVPQSTDARNFQCAMKGTYEMLIFLYTFLQFLTYLEASPRASFRPESKMIIEHNLNIT